MTMYFIRHGETEWNKEDKIQGHKNSPLTEKGEEMARKIGAWFRDKDVQIIYTSDLGRCVQTSEIVNDFLKVDLVAAPELRERDFGDLNGRKNEEVGKALDLSSPDEIAPSGESFNQMKERVLSFIRNLQPKSFGTILLVLHEGGTRAILSEHSGENFDSHICSTPKGFVYRMELENGNFNKLEKFKPM